VKKLTILVLMALLVTVGFVLPTARMVSAAPAAPTLVSPANDATVTGTSVTFEWGSVTGAVKYKLLVSTSTNILDTTKYKANVDLVGETNTTDNDSGYPGNGTRYYWWVWAYAADGSASVWSEVSANGRWFSTPTYATITITPPSAIAFDTLSYTSFNEKAATSGRVTVTPGSSGVVSWSVTATGSAGVKPGFMTGSDNLTNPLLIGYTLAAPGPAGADVLKWTAADGVAIPAGLHGSGAILGGSLLYSGSGTTGTLDFCARQYVEAATDTTMGAYSCTITFTATCLP